MTHMKLSFVGTALLLAWGALHAAEPAGKVLVLQGTATATRAGKDVRLERGSTVESGDVVRVGETSSLQIRFTDESVVALRANTVFNIENYRFAPQEKTGSSIFGLIKGGMRTITGLIGKTNPDSYAVKSSTATIGIRGTHFTAVNCAGDCFNADGSKSEDGLFGSVTDGRIVVRNNAGESEFGRDQFFVVRSIDVSPQPLLSPPGFLRDRLDGQARARGSLQATGSPATSGTTASSQQTVVAATQATATTTVQPTATTAPSAPETSTVSSLGTLTTEATYIPATNPGTTSAVTGGVVGGSPTGGTYSWSEAFAGIQAYSYSDPYGSSSGVDGYSQAYQYLNISTVYMDEEYAWSSGTTSIVDWYKNAYSGSFSGTSDIIDGSTGAVIGTNTYSGTVNKTASDDQGYSTAGNVYWGRFSESGLYTSSDGYSDDWSGTYHWAVGDPVTAMPTSGIFTYTPVGGTSPTDELGNVGSVISRGSWTVDFGNRTIGTASPIAWSMPNGASFTVGVPVQGFTVNTYPMSGGGTYTYYTGTGGAMGYGQLTVSGSCSGTCANFNYAYVGVGGFGAQAEGLAAGVTASGTVGGQESVSGMMNVYKR